MSKQKFKEQSTLGKSIQPILIGIFLLIVAWVGYKVYVALQAGMKWAPQFDVPDLQSADGRSAQESLKKRGVSLEGGKANVQVKRVDTFAYLDKTQRYGVLLLLGWE